MAEGTFGDQELKNTGRPVKSLLVGLLILLNLPIA